ncbi:MAG: DUF1553 domain-containing protein [Planctomycetota bacterium]|nr:MAG: DUF1553 domain-containing protein [Planctomycetota bacterium]REJ95910.1 MAG: DUF1553 domain-containing protein [Planctomycetota bacterium]REK18096.1 MAG: DUF1553 domain-containing protein [Planctomycetota bacterium]
MDTAIGRVPMSPPRPPPCPAMRSVLPRVTFSPGLSAARRIAVAVAVLLVLPQSHVRGEDTAAAAPTAAATLAIDFASEVRPILSSTCFRCHGPDEQTREAGLRLDTREGALGSGGEEGPIVPGDVAASELIRRITSGEADERMPPPDAEKQLAADEIETLKNWIAAGAAWEEHWSFTAPTKPELPAVKQSDWPRGPIDHFVLARMEQEGLSPAPPAERAALLRRVTLDLTGLPPTIAELDAFLADESPTAYEKVVDRLLATPAHAERMALDWLDAARYADTHGYHVDSIREMWRWRDWVIEAFARNMPFDQFTIEQLAGDLLPEATREQKIATGFNRNHGINFEGGAIPEEFRVEYVVDRVQTTATVFMGLTMQCARCHDHKFDPISQRDYYRFFALFNTIGERGIDGATGNARPLLTLPSDEQREAFYAVQQQIEELSGRMTARAKEVTAEREAWVARRLAELEDQQSAANDASTSAGTGDDAITIVDKIILLPAEERTDEQRYQLRKYYVDNFDEEYRRLLAERKKLKRQSDKLYAAIPSVMVMEEMEEPRATFVLNRGLYDQHGTKVSGGVPASLPPLPEGAPANRLSMARWLTSPDHPLTSRVTVNRFWQMYFGTGIVETSENFGSEGTLPTHPRLLDYLATRFVETGWNVRAMQKEIVMSATYRQSSRTTPAKLTADPQNRFLARGPRFRLPAEFIRDNAMAISGLLVKKVGGPSVSPYQPEGLWDEVSFGIKSYGGLIYKQDHGDALYRRGMYTFWKRSCPPPALNTFDAPEREVCTVRRERTNTPLQALVLLNDPTFLEASRHFAERILAAGGSSDADRITYAFRRALARPPTEAERDVIAAELAERRAAYDRDPAAARQILSIGESKRNETLDDTEHAAWTSVARLLLNLDETITKN